MIVVELIGGLGNQMFQYAFGIRLATERQTELVASGFLLKNRLLAKLRHYTYRHFELDAFGIAEPSSSPVNLVRAILPIPQSMVLLRETTTGTAVLPLPPYAEHIVCVGYWQSEHYFKTVKSAVRQQFTFRKPINDFTRRVKDCIAGSPNPVFVHVRRGDYVTNTNASQHHGVCGIDYYKKAIAVVNKQIDSPDFYVFSDDLDWVRQELGPLLGQATYVDGNRGPDSWQDMFLMSQCRHAIIANSSFSWWGAWLNAEPSRIVIAPRNWFTAKTSDQLLPNHWVSL
ncbi:alpha-1,2-fucosyltransferase [Spirosoma rigui]|uniref:alpha-1,2-fucosyltransferase n=1 Tax=Spirosoma rigui TaxID=564064 RepID=UPI0009B163EA|nr:alpha-1,2-fucosyltransferase [Spirosoma rigui]